MRVIEGDAATRSALLYGFNDSNKSYFKEAYDRVSGFIRDKNSTAFNNVKSIYSIYNDDNVIMRAKRLLSESGVGSYNDDYIIRYKNPRKANRIMREYVMANAVIERLYKKGLLDGYSETDYIHDEVMADARRKQVEDNVVQDDGTITNYWSVDGIDLDEERMNFEDQCDIKYTWLRAVQMANNNEDPTDAL